MACIRTFILITLLIPISAFSQTSKWEAEVVQRCNQTQTPFTKALVWSGHYGGKYLPYSLPMVIAGYGWAKGDEQTVIKGLTIEAGCLGSAIVMFGMKQIFQRERPFVDYPESIEARIKETGYSFPSGHTTGAFALATGLTLQYRHLYIAIPSYLFAVGVGVSRIYAGVHYPSDVLVGALVGTASAFLAHWLSKELFPNP